MTSDRVTIAIRGGVADVRLNRPDKKNALDLAMFEALSAASREIADSRDVRAVVLSGEGADFCAGIDLALLRDGTALRDLSARTHGPANLFQNAVWGWRSLAVPVVAAVRGVAFGGGFQITLGADIRVLAPDTRLSIMEGRWGIVPDMGGTALLRNLVRDDVARELTFTAREFSGVEAERLGLATYLDGDPLTSAFELAARIASNSPRAIQGAKRLLNLPTGANAEEQLTAESNEQEKLLRTGDLSEAISAFREKRRPSFSDRP